MTPYNVAVGSDAATGDINWNRFNGLMLLGVLRHPRNEVARLGYLQRKFERKYLDTRDPAMLKKGVEALRDWPITRDPRDPDKENRDLIRRLISLCFELDKEILQSKISLWFGSSRALFISFASHSLRSGKGEIEIFPPTEKGFSIGFAGIEDGSEHDTFDKILHGPLLREIEFAGTCSLDAYFLSSRGDLGITGVDVERLEDGRTVVRFLTG